ncbi:MAG: P-loop NTPase [Promethearchaeota archaeon]
MERKSIGILSGKGGVGKTSIVASLASLASQDSEIRPIIIDCDVDAPNLSILLSSKSNTEINKKSSFSTQKAYFIEEKCINCKKCIEDHYCEFNALRWDQRIQIPIVDYLACEGCNACKVLCPEHAFEIQPVKSGEITYYKSNLGIPLIYGKTRLGSTTSGKLVTEVKQFAQELEEFNDANLILIDGPPGIGCPVISTISGLDYVIAITEPTPSGLHDLIRVIEVIKQFNIKFGIVINKADLKSSFQDNFKKYIQKTGYQILGHIDFDLSFPEAISFAKPVVNYKPTSNASLAIKTIYSELKNILWSNN